MKDKLDQLIASVDKLDGSVRENARELRTFKEDQATKDEQAARRTRMAWRVGLGAVAIGLVALLGVALGVNSQLYQNCRNGHADAFTAAETTKVCGQVQGLAQIVPQTAKQQMRIKVRCGGVPPANPDPRAGIAQFEEASLNYLDAINSTGTKC